MAGVKVGAGGEERVCYNCDKPGHLREDWDSYHAEVHAYLKRRAARGRGRGRAWAGGVEGQQSLSSTQLMCKAWWIVSPVLLKNVYWAEAALHAAYLSNVTCSEGLYL